MPYWVWPIRIDLVTRCNACNDDYEDIGQHVLESITVHHSNYRPKIGEPWCTIHWCPPHQCWELHNPNASAMKGAVSPEEHYKKTMETHLEIQAKLVRCPACDRFTADIVEHDKKCKGRET